MKILVHIACLSRCNCCKNLDFSDYTCHCLQEGSVRSWLQHLHENIIKQPLDCVKVSIPSLVYTLQNNLIFIGVSNLDAAVFQVKFPQVTDLWICIVQKLMSYIESNEVWNGFKEYVTTSDHRQTTYSKNDCNLRGQGNS